MLIDGFIDNIRYRSMTRPGFILSLSNWRDEKALVRWRTQARHHDVQTKGREDVLADYHLRVGQVTTDTHLPAGCVLEEQRLDVTQVGQGTTVALINPLSGDTPAPWSDIATATAALGLQACATALRCQPPLPSRPVTLARNTSNASGRHAHGQYAKVKTILRPLVVPAATVSKVATASSSATLSVFSFRAPDAASLATSAS
jgi:hypothetical protein